MTYASVVSRESVRCALTLAALNDLQVKAGDIQNGAYLTAPFKEKITCICGPEFGEDAGKTARLIQALYAGLKSSGAAYGDHLVKEIRHFWVTPLSWQTTMYGS
jgi:hypothetical protein